MSILVVVYATAFVGRSVCHYGNGFCADNVIPGPLIAGVLFTLVHLASSLAYRPRRWGKSILIGAIGATAATSLPIYVAPERGNVIVALAVGSIWTCLFAVECLLKRRP